MSLPRQFITLAFFILLLVACDETASTDTPVSSTPAVPPVAQTLGANETPFSAEPTSVPPVASASYCQNGGAILAKSGEALAAKVNGQPIPLSLYQRQAAQAQVALVSQGLDPKTQAGQDEIKGLQQQVLAQLIDDLIIEQAARQENVSVTDQDVSNRIQQLINDLVNRHT